MLVYFWHACTGKQFIGYEVRMGQLRNGSVNTATTKCVLELTVTELTFSFYIWYKKHMAKASNPSTWDFINIHFKHLSVRSKTMPNMTLWTHVMYSVDIFQIYGSFTHRSSIILSVIINSGQKWRNFKEPKNDVMNLKEYDIDKLTISGSLESIFKFVTELT